MFAGESPGVELLAEQVKAFLNLINEQGPCAQASFAFLPALYGNASVLFLPPQKVHH
jgi:hypothetical protein